MNYRISIISVSMVQMHITDRINRISRGYKTDEDENSTYGVEQLGLLWSNC